MAWNFAGSHFCEFSNGLQKLITANIFPGKIYFRVNILLLKLATKNTVLRNCVCSTTTCLNICNYLLSHCTYSVKTKILSKICPGLSEIAKIYSQREKPIFPNRKYCCHKIQKIANLPKKKPPVKILHHTVHTKSTYPIKNDNKIGSCSV